MKKLLGYLLTPIFYFTFGLFLGIFHPIQWICYKIFGYSAHKWSVDVLNFFLTYSQLTLLNGVSFRNDFKLPKDRPIIFVANHQSLFDIIGIIWYLRRFHAKFVSIFHKTEIRIAVVKVLGNR